MIESICARLAAYEEINHGCNHNAEFELHRLPDANSLIAALESYFAVQRTSISPPRPSSDWHIEILALDTPTKILDTALRHWLLENRPPDNNESLDGLPDLSRLASDFNDTFELNSAFAVTVRLPLWYGCEWEDFAFARDEEHYLLHLGYSD